jgi:outer membrane protein OmpA-like peptidoglycan-associated protein
MANTGLRLGCSFIPALNLYAGAGVDWIIETGGTIPLPAVELGITFKPFLLEKRFRPRAARPALAPEPPVAPMREPELAVEPEPVPKPEPAAVPEPEIPVRILQILYFPADAEFPIPSHMAGLDAAGELLRASPDLAVTLRGYTAPYSTPGARRILSELRARFCENYLRSEYGIADERITVEWYGADRLPEGADGTDWRRRCVDIIIENRKGGES